MRLRHITGSEDYVLSSDYVCHEPENLRGRWNRDFFRNENAIHVEIGMGKGQFLITLAKQNPHINYIGIERYDTVLLKAIKKRERLETEGEKLENLTFLSVDARELPNIFSEEEISRIYLNFSDPWPKNRQANRRLTSPVFLKIYDKFLKKEGTLEFKTDNEALFDYSLESIEESAWNLKAFTRDLHRDIEMNTGNIMTEYEEKFSQKGNPIYKCIIARNDSKEE